MSKINGLNGVKMSKDMSNQVKISVMSGKLKGLSAINSDTTSNDYCIRMSHSQNPEVVCTKCYSHQMLGTFRKNCVPAFRHNSDLLSKRLLNEDELPRVKDKFCRIHAHGEIINLIHARNLMRIAAKNPSTQFAFFTKRANLLDEAISLEKPVKNVIKVFSNPTMNKILPGPPKGFDKVFNVVSEDNGKIHCGNMTCLECQKCYHKRGAQVMYELVKTYGKRS